MSQSALVKTKRSNSKVQYRRQVLVPMQLSRGHNRGSCKQRQTRRNKMKGDNRHRTTSDLSGSYKAGERMFFSEGLNFLFFFPFASHPHLFVSPAEGGRASKGFWPAALCNAVISRMARRACVINSAPSRVFVPERALQVPKQQETAPQKSIRRARAHTQTHTRSGRECLSMDSNYEARGRQLKFPSQDPKGAFRGRALVMKSSLMTLFI